MSIINRRTLVAFSVLGLAALTCAPSQAQEVRRFRFAYDQPLNTGYNIAGNIFNAKLGELSKKTMVIDQFPGGQLGQEPQLLQMVKNGDVDFIISSTANASTVTPQAGVMSLHYLFKSEAHLIKSLGSPELSKAVREMVRDTVQGAQALAVMTLGLRNMYGKKEVKSVDDLKGMKVRVQATPTEDATFPAYGAQTTHMPFGSVYTSLQTGVVDFAENGVNVYLANKHYEVAPVLSMTNHEANNSLLWVSDKTWNSLSADQKAWVQEAANEVARTQPAKALDLEHQSVDKLKAIGVKVVENVDTVGMAKMSDPFLEKFSNELGPHAVKIAKIIKSLQ